jgi:uncharacterized membrane protein YhaH (DUF805 family)
MIGYRRSMDRGTIAGLFSFQGRTNRLAYWRINLLCTALAASAWCVGIFAVLEVGPAGAIAFAGLPPVYAIMLAATLRRLHDRGKNGWWLLFFSMTPFVLVGLTIERTGSAIAGLVMLIASAVYFWGLVEIGFMRGATRANQYGPPPLSR